MKKIANYFKKNNFRWLCMLLLISMMITALPLSVIAANVFTDTEAATLSSYSALTPTVQTNTDPNLSDGKGSWDGNDIHLGIVTSSLDKDIPYSYDVQTGHTYHAEKNNETLGFTVELSQVVDYEVQFRVVQTRVQNQYFTAFNDFVSEYGYEMYSDEWHNEYQTKENAFNVEQQAKLDEEGNLFVLSDEIRTIPAGQTSINVEFAQGSNIENGTGTRLSEISLSVLTEGVGQNFDTGYRGMVTYHIYDLDGENELIVLTPSNVYENESYVEIPVIRTGNNAVISGENTPSFTYKLSDNINIGGENEITASQRFENYNSVFTFAEANGVYENKSILCLNIIDNADIGYLEQYKVYLSDFINCGDTITTTILGEKFSSDKKISVTFSIYDDEYELLNLADYTEANLLYNEYNDSYISVVYNGEYNIFLNESDETKNLIVSISRGGDAPSGDIRIGYTLTMDEGLYGESFTIGNSFDEFTRQGTISFANGETLAYIPINLIDDKVINKDVAFKLKFSVLEGDNVLFSRGKSTLGVKIQDDDYLPTDSHVEFGYFNGAYWDGTTVDLRRPGMPENYISDGEVDAVISTFTYINTTFPLVLYSNDYRGNIPMTFAVKVEDITATSGIDYSVPSQIIYVQTDLIDTDAEIEFVIKNQFFEGVKRFKFTILEEYLPQGMSLGEKTEFVVDIIGIMPEGFWFMDKNDISVKKGENILLTLTRYSTESTATQIGITDFNGNAVDTSDYFAEGTFPMNIEWALGETQKNISIPVLNNERAEQYSTYLKLLLLDDNGNVVSNANLDEFYTSCSLNIDNTYNGGYFFFESDNRAFLQEDGALRFYMNRGGNVSEEATIYYRLSEDESIAESERAIDGIDFVSGIFSYTFSAGVSEAYVPVQLPEYVIRKGNLRKLKVELIGTSSNAVLCSNHYQFAGNASYLTEVKLWLDWDTQVTVSNISQKPHISPYNNGTLTSGVVRDNYENSSGELSPTFDTIYYSDIVLDFAQSSSISLNVKNINQGAVLQTETAIYLFVANDLTAQGVTISYDGKVIPQRAITDTERNIWNSISRASTQGGPQASFIYYYKVDLKLNNEGEKVLNFTLEEGYNAENVNFDLYPVFYGGVISSSSNEYLRNIITNGYEVEQGIAQSYDLTMQLYTQNDSNLSAEISSMPEYGVDIPGAANYYQLKIVRDGDISTMLSLYLGIKNATLGKDLTIITADGTPLANGAPVIFSTGEWEKIIYISVPKNKSYYNVTTSIGLYTDSACKNLAYERVYTIYNAEKFGTFSIVPAISDKYDYVDTDKITVYIIRQNADLLPLDTRLIFNAPSYQIHSTYSETYVHIYSGNNLLRDSAYLHFSEGQSIIELTIEVAEDSPYFVEWQVGVTNANWRDPWFQEIVDFSHFDTNKSSCVYSEEDSTTTEYLYKDSKLPQASPRQSGNNVCGELGNGFSNMGTKTPFVIKGMYGLGEGYYLNVTNTSINNNYEKFVVGNSTTGEEIELDTFDYNAYYYEGNHLQYTIYDFNSDGVKDIMLFATYYENFYEQGSGIFIYDVKTSTMRKVFDTPEWYGNYSFGIRDLDTDGDFEFFYLCSPNNYRDYVGDVAPETKFGLYEILSDGTFKTIYSCIEDSEGHPVYHYEVVEATENNIPYIRLYYYAGSEWLIEDTPWLQTSPINPHYTFDTSYGRISLRHANKGVLVNVSSYTINENGELEITVIKPGDNVVDVTIEITDSNLIEGLNITSLQTQTVVFSADEHIKTIKYKLLEDGVNKTDLFIDFKITAESGLFWNSAPTEFRVNVENETYVTSDLKYSVQDEITDKTFCPSSISGKNLLIDASYLKFNTHDFDKFTYQVECNLFYVNSRTWNDYVYETHERTWISEMNSLNLTISDLPSNLGCTIYKNYMGEIHEDYQLGISIKIYYNGELYHIYYIDRVLYNNNITDTPDVHIAPSGTVGHYWNIDIAAKESQRFNYGCEIIDENGKSTLFKSDENGVLDVQYMLPNIQGTYNYTVKIYNYNLDTVDTRQFTLPVYGSAQIGLLTLFEYDSRPLSLQFKIEGTDNNFYAEGSTDANGIAIVEGIPAGKNYRITIGENQRGVNTITREIFLSNDNYMETFNLTMNEQYSLYFSMSKIDRDTFDKLYKASAVRLNKGDLLQKELDFGWAIMHGEEKASTMIVQMAGKAPNKLEGQQKEAYNRAVEIVRDVRRTLLTTNEYAFFDYGRINLFSLRDASSAPEYVELEDDEILYCSLKEYCYGYSAYGLATIKSLYGDMDFYRISYNYQNKEDLNFAFVNHCFNWYDSALNFSVEGFGWVVCKDDDYYELELHDDFLFEETNGIKTIPLLSVGAGLATSLVQDVDSVMAEVEDIEIPDNIKFFGGATIGLGIGDCGDLEFEYDKENMTLSVRLGAAKNIKDIGTDPDKLLTDFKNVLKNNRSGALKMGGGYANMNMGVGAVIEYFYNTETRMWELDWGRMYFASSFTIGYTVYAVVPVVYIPVYINGEVTLSTEIGLILDWDNANQEVDVDGDASVAVRLHIEAGIGVPGLLSVGIYGETEIKITIQFSTGASKTELYVDGGVKLTVLFWRKTISFGRYENEWTSDGWRDYTTRALYSSRLSEFEQLSAYSGVACVYDCGVMTAAYALDEGGEVASTLFVENVYESAVPQIAERNDGTKMMAWINYDATRGINNAEVINYIYFDGEAWSEVAVVDSSATADVDFTLLVIDGKYVLAYLDVDTLSENDTISDRLLSTDVAMSVYDEGSDTWNKTVILDNDYNDNRILMRTDGESAVILVYETRNANITDDMTVGDYLGGENADNVLLVKSYRNDEWSDFSVLLDTDIPPIVNMSCVVIDGVAYILLNIDMDSDFTTVNDREIMLVKYYISASFGEREYLTNDETKDSAPVAVELDVGPVYVYNAGNELKYIIDGVSYTLDTDFDADLEDITAYSSDEYIALVWECIDEVGQQQIAMSLLDRTNKRFSEPFAVTTTDKVSRDAIVLFNENGADLYFCDDTYMPIYSEVADENGEYSIDDFTVESEIVMQEYSFTSDIQIIGLDYEVEKLKPGEINEFTIKIINNGILAVNNAKIKLYNGETQIGEYTIDGIIRGGGYLEYILYVALPEETFTLTAELYEGDGLVFCESFDIIMRDLAVVSYVTSERENNYKAVVLVQNNGGTDEENIKVYIAKYSDSSIIYAEATIGSLASGKSASVSFDIPKEYVSFNGLGLAWFKVIILANGETLETLFVSDYEITNNTYEMFILESDMGESIMTVPSEMTLDINESSTFEVIYTGNGTLNYSSADEEIATVSGTTITAHGIGTTTIIISDGTYTAYISVTVCNIPSIVLNGDTSVSLPVGERYKEQGAAVVVNGETLEDAKISIRGSVNNLVCSKYVITYTYSQGGEVVAIAKRTVNVIPESPKFTTTDDSVSGYTL